MPDADELTHSDIEGAVVELSALSGLPGPDIWAAVRECAGGERDVVSLSYGVSQVADALGGSGAGYVGLTDYSDDERRELAARGWALPDGSYPIRNEDDLHNAAALARSGHGDAEAAKRLIAKRARELGVANPLADDDSDDVAASYYDRDGYSGGHYTGSGEVMLTRTGRELDPYDETDSEIIRLSAASPRAAEMFGLAARDGVSTDSRVEAIAARHPDILGARPDRGNARATRRGLRTARAEAEGGRGTHTRNCPPGCTRDHNQPSRGGETHPEIRALMERHPGMFGHPFGGEHPQSGNFSAHPLSPAARESAERAARPGHTY
jgi:hypothetical protein